MFKVKETTTAEVYAHALDDDTKPIFKGTEVFHEDIHDHVTYHADRAVEAADAAWSAQAVDSSTHTLPDGRTVIGKDAYEAEVVKAVFER